jgi:hypothetical protein
MRTGKIPPHHELANLCYPGGQQSRIDPTRLTMAAEHLGRCTTGHVLEHLNLPITRANEMLVAKHLRGMGYIKGRARVGTTLHWVFFPPQEAAS